MKKYIDYKKKNIILNTYFFLHWMFLDNFKINLSNILNTEKKNESFFWMEVNKIFKLSWKIQFTNFNHITLTFITFPCLI